MAECLATSATCTARLPSTFPTVHAHSSILSRWGEELANVRVGECSAREEEKWEWSDTESLARVGCRVEGRLEGTLWCDIDGKRAAENGARSVSRRFRVGFASVSPDGREEFELGERLRGRTLERHAERLLAKFDGKFLRRCRVTRRRVTAPRQAGLRLAGVGSVARFKGPGQVAELTLAAVPSGTVTVTSTSSLVCAQPQPRAASTFACGSCAVEWPLGRACDLALGETAWRPAATPPYCEATCSSGDLAPSCFSLATFSYSYIACCVW